MAPFSQATKVKLVSKSEGESVYQGEVDGEWTIISVPNGGYVLALILESCIAHQSRTMHKDPIHVSAHFLRTTSVTSFEVHVREVKKGRAFTNLTAELVQKGAIRVTTHLIFGTLRPAEAPLARIPDNNSPYARHHPMTCLPSQCKPGQLFPRFSMGKHLVLAEDDNVFARNKAPNFDNTQGLQSATWYEFAEEEEVITPASLAFWADMFSSITRLMPKELVQYNGRMWFPTLTMTIQFLAPLPPRAAPRTVGVYARTSFVGEPQGQNMSVIEVWSAPSGIGQEGVGGDDWAKDQVCLAVSTQMALIVPAEVNVKLGGAIDAKL